MLKNKGYNFSPKEFKSLAEKAKGEGISTVAKLASDLKKVYGPLISKDLVWSGFQAGGMQLKALVLHGGLTEFIVAFQAPFATTGRSGMSTFYNYYYALFLFRHPLRQFDLHGSQWFCSACFRYRLLR